MPSNESALSEGFARWVDEVFSGFADESVAAFNFNLYEHENAFAVQLVATSRFDTEDDSWAAEETFSSAENLFEMPHDSVGADWREGLEACRTLVLEYLSRGRFASRMKSAQGIGIGFVDGDIHILY